MGCRAGDLGTLLVGRRPIVRATARSRDSARRRAGAHRRGGRAGGAAGGSKRGGGARASGRERGARNRGGSDAGWSSDAERRCNALASGTLLALTHEERAAYFPRLGNRGQAPRGGCSSIG